MKILHIITQAALGGAQSVVIELSNACSNDGHDVFVMSKTNGAMWDLLDKKVCAIKCDYFRRNISPLNELKSYFAIKKALKTINPDIIHLHTSKVGALGRLAAFPKYTKKTIYTMHGFDQVRIANRKFLPVEKLLKNMCKKIVAITKCDADNMQKCGIKNLEYIPNSVKDIQVFENSSSVNDKINACANNRKIIMTIARDATPKRFDLFVEIAQQLPEYCFIWIGNKNEYSLPVNMYCFGEIPNASVYMKNSDIFVLLSDHEGLPMTIIEAFSCGIPVIASNVGGIPEVIDSSCGAVLKNESILFTEKITELLADPDNLSELKFNARKKYEENYTIDKMKNAYLSIYNA